MRQESWSECADEIVVLAEASWDETVPGLEPERRFDLDREAFAAMDRAGVLVIVTARGLDSSLLGYCSWVLQFDLESRGALIAQQGSWHAAAGCWGVGWKVFQASLVVLRQLGVQRCYPHKRATGRSAGADRFFKRLGGVAVMTVYSIELGSSSSA